MVVVRPVGLDDLDRLTELAVGASFGLTSLPRDKELLRKRVQQSVEVFSKSFDQPSGELYFFVMEDLEAHLVVGTSCIISKVGGFEPFYTYRVETCVHHSGMLNITKEIQTLNLVAEHRGPCEIGGLYLVPEYRKGGKGRLLSLFRFLYMAEHPERFEPTIVAEMRGVMDESGHSPFWEALGRHFFDMDYPKADYLTSVDKRFIADLMPKCPIYVPLLPKEAQAVIGKVHEKTRPALKMLEDEGFRYGGMVDIFEAGPLVYCRLDDIRIVRESRTATVHKVTSAHIESAPHIIMNTRIAGRACVGSVDHQRDVVRVTKATAEALDLSEGDPLRFAPVRPAESHKEGE